MRIAVLEPGSTLAPAARAKPWKSMLPEFPWLRRVHVKGDCGRGREIRCAVGNDGNPLALRSMRTQRSPARAAAGPRQSLSDAIDRRIAELRVWLKENAPECADAQNHLDANTSARGYWHHGYLVALIDMRNLLQDKDEREKGRPG